MSRRHPHERKQEQLLSIRHQLARLRHVPRALRLVWSAAAGWTLALGLLLLIQGLLPVAAVYLTRPLVDALAGIIRHGPDAGYLPAALWTGSLLALALLAGEMVEGASAYVQTALGEKTQEQMNLLIQTKAVSLDLRFFDLPDHYDQLQRACFDAIDRPLALMHSLGSLIQNSITLLAMGSVLLNFAWWMPLVLLAGTAPALWVALRTTWRFHTWRQRNTKNQRRLAYLQRTLTTDQAAAEVRLFNLGDHFIEAGKQLRQRLTREKLALARRQMTGQMGASFAGLLAVFINLCWMGWQAMRGVFTLGDLAMFYQAMNQGQRLMRTLLTGAGEIYRNLLFLDDLFIFLDLEPVMRDPERPVPGPAGLHEAVRLEQVSFRYPESEHLVLDRLDLELPAGRIVALVGENGAGKSTLIRLLCRFYDPVAGRITWDGTDLREFSGASLRLQLTVLFQQPVTYHETAADNIAFGDLARRPSGEEIAEAARMAGAAPVIEKLPAGYGTVLGKWFGLNELSVGEWQRIALSRAFIRQASLVILDEPTSAMDAWAEAGFMERFRTLTEGRTALIITHRFTTARQADIIHVMAAGRIVESGSHEQLLALDGRYATSWRQQIRETATSGLTK